MEDEKILKRALQDEPTFPTLRETREPSAQRKEIVETNFYVESQNSERIPDNQEN